jgi:hypothetical protein
MASQLGVILKCGNLFGGWDLNKTFGTVNSQYRPKRYCGISTAMPTRAQFVSGRYFVERIDVEYSAVR